MAATVARLQRSRPSSGRRTRRHPRHERRLDVASTEPPLVGAENLSASLTRCAAPGRFNGAAPRRGGERRLLRGYARGHVASTEPPLVGAENRAALDAQARRADASTEPPLVGAENTRRYMRMTSSLSFNGAAPRRGGERR